MFGIDDLARVGTEPWTGVRNTWARNYMRDQMQVDDRVLFYHSSCQPPGVAGLARVSRTDVVDETQFDPASPYFDEKATRDKPVWWCVEVELVEKLPRLVALDELRRRPGLEGMILLRATRLSVQPVAERRVRDRRGDGARAGPRPSRSREVKPKPKPKPRCEEEAREAKKRAAKKKPTPQRTR